MSRFFRGWWIVGATIVGQTFSLGTMIIYTFGVFAKPLANEFHAGRASIALAVSFVDFVVTFSAPGAGRLADRYGARRVILAAVLGLAAALVALAYVEPPLWHLYALYAVAGLAGIATTSVTYARVIANWFDKRRGLALGLASTGVGLGAFITPSLAQFLIEKAGWRGAYLGLAGASLMIALPVVAVFLRASPQEVGLLPDGASAPRAVPSEAPRAPGLTVSQALRTLTFWQLCAIFFCVAACVNGVSAHLAPLLTDGGMSARSAALAASVFGGASLIGRVVNGYFADRYFAPRVAAILFAGAAMGTAILWNGSTGVGSFAAAALLGLGLGAESDVMPLLISRYFGMRSMAELYGCAFGSYTLGNATGRYLMGAGFDAAGSYRAPLAYMFAGAAVAVIATLRLERFPKLGQAL